MRAYIKISSTALVNNINEIKRVAPEFKIIAMIKSYAYGHGLLECAKILSKHVYAFGVATLQEAMILRKTFFPNPILLFERTDEYSLVQRFHLTLIVYSLEHLDELIKTTLPLHINLAVDSGLGRIGILPEEFEEALMKTKKSHLHFDGFYTHHQSFEDSQRADELFNSLLNKVELSKLLIHSDSTSTLSHLNKSSNAIRVGLALYGLSSIISNLKPVLSLYVPVIRCREVKANTFVGYHGSGRTPTDGYILTIPLGYKDGWSPKNKILAFKDTYLPQIGDLMMDHAMLFSKTKIEVGETLELIGPNIRIKELAKLYQESEYIIVTRLHERLLRIVEK